MHVRLEPETRVSIRSRLFETGELYQMVTFMYGFLFQSAPVFLRRENGIAILNNGKHGQFQSAPVFLRRENGPLATL